LDASNALRLFPDALLLLIFLYYLDFLAVPALAAGAAGAALAAPFTLPLSCFGFFASRLPFF
jgi:hypothetical protein